MGFLNSDWKPYQNVKISYMHCHDNFLSKCVDHRNIFNFISCVLRLPKPVYLRCIHRAVINPLAAPLWYCASRRHIPRFCGYDVRCCHSKKQGVYIIFSYIFLTWHYRRGFRAHLPLGLPFVIFAWERRWGAAIYDVTWHLLSFGCYGNFRYTAVTLLTDRSGPL